ncbi:SagB family peptide dehydrogenase [Aerosakkonema funiforme]|uniref:SagB family peptide dehydrogenase n=1 Tax=Aerosakkonema funiforme TaxID=1246630 RepID=UPI0035BB1E17
MPQPIVLSFKENLDITEESSGNFVFKLLQINFNLKQLSPGLIAAINVLRGDGATEESLHELVLKTDGFSSLTKLYYYLQEFTLLGIICHSIRVDGVTLATMVPISTAQKVQLVNAAPDKKYVLSRFAFSRKDGEQMVLESPLSHVQIILSDWRGSAIVNSLTKPQTASQVSALIPAVSNDTVQMFFSLLLTAGMVSEVKAEGQILEQENDTLAQWEFHDLLFHSRSRAGRHSNPLGKSYRFLGKIEPPPVVKPKVSNDIIQLDKPDLEKLKQEDNPFTLIIEQRDSIRVQGNQPITDKQLGEFLYRTARVRATFPKDEKECSDRPYANGGACYELEFYIIVNRCENIPEGLYHYCPLDHQLCKISDKNSYLETLLKNAETATVPPCNPQILIILATRFPRVSWGYESMAYALTLKHVGVLYQTMYLVATAMNLAPCAIGGGNSDLFATATGCDYYAETSVGEFMLGSRA